MRHLLPVVAAVGVRRVEQLSGLGEGDLRGLGLADAQVSLLRGAIARWRATMSVVLHGSISDSPTMHASSPTSSTHSAWLGMPLGSPMRGGGGGGTGEAPPQMSPALARATGALVTDAVVASVKPGGAADAFAPGASAGGSPAAPGSSGRIGGGGNGASYEWEEYATKEGFLYYNNVRGGSM
jgi:hypothetical protein